LPENFFTVWVNAFETLKLKRGDTFLVHGGSSGIGLTAIQLAKAFGATVFTTAGSDEKTAFCTKVGADHAINYRTQDFEAGIAAIVGKRGVDVILDMVGGDYINKNLNLLAVEGRLGFIAFLQGPKAEVDFARLMLRRQTITGSTLRARPDAQKAAIAAALLGERVAAGRGGHGEAGHPRGVRAGPGGRGAPPHGIEPAHRQDHAGSGRHVRVFPMARGGACAINSGNPRERLTLP
jgi:NADPH:quinone reductase-like Zn-dependent oxidoreductase